MTAIAIGFLTPQGLVPADYSADSLANAVTKEPQGVYTVGRTYQRDHILLFDDHLDRLENSALLEGIPVQLDRLALRKAMRCLIDRSGYPESRFRITIPRTSPERVIISLEPFKPVPAEIMQNGARVVTVHLARHNPVAKSTAWIAERKSAVESFPPGIYEGILVTGEGTLLEGTSSNFYGILDGTLRTAGDAVLSGIARRALLAAAADILPVDLRPVHVDEIPKLDEAFLTSAARGVVPIVEIDGQRIRDGKPGPFTLRLRAAYDAWAAAHLESI